MVFSCGMYWVQVMEVVSMATSLRSEEQQNKFAQLLLKTHMSYSDTEENQTSLINLHFQKCLQKVNFIQAINTGFYVIVTFIIKASQFNTKCSKCQSVVINSREIEVVLNLDYDWLIV